MRGSRLWLLAALSATPALGLVGLKSATATSPAETINQFLRPSVTFLLTEEDVDPSADDVSWRTHARKIATLQQIEDCSEDLLGSTIEWVEAAAEGDALAMAALGTVYLLGQECSPKRNLTWAVHWLQHRALRRVARRGWYLHLEIGGHV